MSKLLLIALACGTLVAHGPVQEPVSDPESVQPVQVEDLDCEQPPATLDDELDAVGERVAQLRAHVEATMAPPVLAEVGDTGQ